MVTLPVQNKDFTNEERPRKNNGGRPYKTMDNLMNQDKNSSKKEEEKAIKTETKVGINEYTKIYVSSEQKDQMFENIEDAIKFFKESISNKAKLSNFNNGRYNRSFVLRVDQSFYIDE